MKKIIFNVVTFILCFVLYYLFWMFVYLGEVPLADWNNLDRGAWLILGLILSIVGVNASIVIAWNWYYALDKKEI